MNAPGGPTHGPEHPRRRNPVTMLLVDLVRAYQLVVSPWYPPRCKYHPSCSSYAVTALQVHGPLRGTALAAWRLLRCNPWSLGGVDYVPPRAGSPPSSADSQPDPSPTDTTADSAGVSSKP